MTDNALHLIGPEQIVLVDFDVSQSFGHEASGWVMHPVVTGGDLDAAPGQELATPLVAAAN